MRAYDIFKTEEDIESFHLANVVDNETFDDNLGAPRDYMTESSNNGKKIKKIYPAPKGQFYGIKKDTGRPVRFITLNMSRVDEDYFYKVLRHIEKKYSPDKTNTNVKLKRSVMEIPYPIALRLRPFLNRLRSIKHRILG